MLKIAGFEDIEDIKRMSNRFYSASPYGGLEIDQEKVEAVITDFLDSDKTEKVIILSCSDRPRGMIAGIAQEFLFNRKRIALEAIWWMDPEYRNGREAIKLVEAYEYWAKNVAKTDLIQLSLLTTEQAPQIEKFYSRRGYRLSEKSFYKELGINDASN